MNASSGSSSSKVLLSDILLENLKSRRLGDYSVSWLCARAVDERDDEVNS